MDTIYIILISIATILLVCYMVYRHYRIHIYAWNANFPKPKYRVHIDHNVMIPMKDGTKLATDVYRPRSRGKYPVILIRTPYNKSGHLHPYRQLAELFVSQGYVVIVQDVRGKYGSEGGFYPYAYEGLDGHTTVTWAGEASWSNGRVAMLGLSYLGSCAWLASRYKSPYLRTIVTMFTTQNTYSIWIEQGIPFLKGPLSWLVKYGGKRVSHRLEHTHLESVLWQLPVNNLENLIAKHKITFYKDYLSHIKPDPFWEELSADHYSSSLDIPAFIVGGWYDPFLRGTLDDFNRMMQSPETSKNRHSQLVLGPWTHNPAQKFKGFTTGKNADFSQFLCSTLDWCDIWLKEKSPISRSKNKVRYYVMGSNEWKESEQWPPANINYQKYFLSSDPKSLTHRFGILSDTPAAQTQTNCFIYNPRDPVLFRGSYLLDRDGWIEPIEQTEILARDDVIIFNTAPLQKELMIAGPTTLILYVSSDAFDTDFCAKICDVHPNGKSYNLATGFIRMRFRESLENPVMMIPGAIYRVVISIRSVANMFLKNHRIQLQVTSSDFPVHDRNLNTGLNCETSVEIQEVKQTIYTGGPYESCLLLPVMQNSVLPS